MTTKIKVPKIPVYKEVEILPEYLEKIKDGSKVFEFRKWYSKASHFLLKSTETQRVEAVVEIEEVIDLNLLDEESKEEILDQGKVSQKFREEYNCRYCYIIRKVENVH